MSRKTVFLEHLCDFFNKPRAFCSVVDISQQLLTGTERILTSQYETQKVWFCNALNRYAVGKVKLISLVDVFSVDLEKANLDVNVKMLQLEEGSEGYIIEFGRNYYESATKDTWYSAGIVLFEKLDDTQGRLAIVILPVMSKSGWSGNVFSLCIRLPSSGSISYLVSACTNQPAVPKKSIEQIFKSVLYYKSAEPKIERLPAVISGSKAAHKVRNTLREHCPFDLIRLGYGFHGRSYSQEHSLVRGHPRWQPYGPGLSKVKLIWIDEHVRTYDHLKDLACLGVSPIGGVGHDAN
jgi:hypothetical protein